MKKVLIIRLGAFGDLVMASPLFRLFKQDGWHVTLNVNPRGRKVVENNPYIDDFILHPDDSVPNEKLGEHWEKLSVGFDKVVNLSGSIEGALLKTRNDPQFFQPQYARHSVCNVNYYDRTLELGGYGHIKGLNGEMYFSSEEEKWGQSIRDQHKKRFLVLWSLSGSAVHKFYPWSEMVAPQFLDKHPDAVMFTVGEPACALIEWKHPRNKRRVGSWDIRRSFVMTKYADLVVGPETGVLNAAGCFETPKIVLLSHSSHENLSKYWKNCTPVEADKAHAPCHPCHRMIYHTDDCMLNATTKLPVCMAHLEPSIVTNALENAYQQWKEKTDGMLDRQGRDKILS